MKNTFYIYLPHTVTLSEIQSHSIYLYHLLLRALEPFSPDISSQLGFAVQSLHVYTQVHVLTSTIVHLHTAYQRFSQSISTIEVRLTFSRDSLALLIHFFFVRLVMISSACQG
jgi:hypothetical protein